MRELPTRGSVDDPDIDWDVASRVEILLNGIPRDRVISFDVEARTLTRCATDEKGNFIVEGDEIKRETLHGDVAVRWRAEA